MTWWKKDCIVSSFPTEPSVCWERISAATEKKQQLLQEIRSLSRMPQRFPFFEALYIPPNKYHKLYVENWYLILYQIRDDTVYVDYILDCRKEYSWLLQT